MLNITNSALEELKKRANGQEKKIIRLGVRGGGCSGLEYSMDWIERKKIDDHDKVKEIDDLSIVFDPKSSLYLSGLTLDYSNDMIGGGFVFQNPNAERSCSCGKSFSV